MSISCIELEPRVLLRNQLSYDAIVRVGSSCQAGWRIEDVEPDAVFDGFRGELFLEPRASTGLERGLAVLDGTVPLFRFGEEGRHFAYGLFLSPLDYWGSRGAPFFWAYAARRFTFDELPMPEARLERKRGAKRSPAPSRLDWVIGLVAVVTLALTVLLVLGVSLTESRSDFGPAFLFSLRGFPLAQRPQLSAQALCFLCPASP